MEEVTSKLSKLDVSDTKIERKLIGSYSWLREGEIFIPGFPANLKKEFMSTKIPRLKEETALPNEFHPNEYLHDVYFEPVEAILEEQKISLSSFDIITDRNNIRKIDAALRNDVTYPNFEIQIRLYGNTLVFKRIQTEGGTSLGRGFEKAITYPSDFQCCHCIFQLDVKFSNEKCSVLVRSEVDALSTDAKRNPSLNDYKEPRESDSGLKIHILNDERNISIVDLREITMSRELKDSNFFQSAIVGIPYIVHGVQVRKETFVKNTAEYNQRVENVIRKMREFKDEIKEGETYSLKRENGGQLTLQSAENIDNELAWFASM